MLRCLDHTRAPRTLTRVQISTSSLPSQGSNAPFDLVYYQLVMRRVLSLVFTLFFSLGPLASCFGSADDARLPACCRRHGTHHCTMSGMANAEQAAPKPVFAAPSHCPLYPDSIPASASSIAALATPVAHAVIAAAQDRVLLDEQQCSKKSPHRTCAGRGPPASTLA